MASDCKKDMTIYFRKSRKIIIIIIIIIICLITHIRNKIELQHVYILEISSVRKGIKN